MPFFGPFLKYADFAGRAARLEYWTFQALNVGIRVFLLILAWQTSWWLLVLLVVYILAAFLPSWALSVRRLHDSGRSGWWLLLHWIPFGSFVLFIFYLIGSDGDNEYGQEPR